jgi:hypothetical protein
MKFFGLRDDTGVSISVMRSVQARGEIGKIRTIFAAKGLSGIR